jgi:hypothetical protein
MKGVPINARDREVLARDVDADRTANLAAGRAEERAG